jgi:hypothetical protein
MRTLVFEPGGKAFQLCYQSAVLSQMPLAKSELRTHGALLTKLETIGVIQNAARDPAKDIALFDSPMGGAVPLEDAEYEMLRRLLDSIVGTINKSLTREMQSTIDWLDSLKPDPVVPAAPAVPATDPA